jgi:thiol-disulfide isomerase/thioredoxin
MKLINCCLFMLMTTALLAANVNTRVTIQGAIRGDLPEEIMYTIPVNGTCNYAFKATLVPEKNGRFFISFDVDRVSFMKFGIYGEWGKTMIVEPGETYELEIDRRSEPNPIAIKGKAEAAQMLYLDLPQPGFLQQTARFYVPETDAGKIKTELLAKQDQEIAGFRELLDQKKISKDLYELVELDRQCFYAGVIGSVALIKFFEDNRNQDGQFTEEIKAMWANAYGDWPARAPEMMRSGWYLQTTESFLDYQDYMDESFSEEKMKAIYEANKLHTHNLEVAEKYLSGEPLAFFKAVYLHYEAFQKKYEQELVDLFEQFKRDYPNSPYPAYIAPMIEPIVAFHRQAQADFGEDIRFVENGEQMGSLEELVATLKGKKVYIDVWATWCGPCKQEFVHNSDLQEVTKATDTEILYISVDKPEAEKQWKDMIKYYDLRGHHVLVNPALEKELRELFGQGGMISIPWYMLFDKEGQLAETHASRPSELKQLRKALEKI